MQVYMCFYLCTCRYAHVCVLTNTFWPFPKTAVSETLSCHTFQLSMAHAAQAANDNSGWLCGHGDQPQDVVPKLGQSVLSS